jgi:type I restriction enzyme, S subunit
MSSTQWETVTLGDVTTESRKRAGSDPDFYNRPVYGVDRSIGLTPVAKYTASSFERYKTLDQGMFAYNPMRLNIGSIGYCSQDIEPGLVSPDYVVFQCNEKCLNPEFLNYYIDSPEWKDWTASAGVGSVRMRIYYRELARLPFLLPPINEQHAIAEILRTLDDKIELNHRMNRTLESIARAVFRQWFVENEEVQDWEVSKIRDVCEKVENGGTPRRDQPEYWEPATIPWLTSGEVRQDIIISTENKISEDGYKNSSAKMWGKGATVVALYGATAGEVSFVAHDLCANQACCGLVPKDGWQYFVYLTLSTPENSLASQARGSAQQNLSQQIVADFSIRKPDQKQLVEFNKIVAPIFDKWIANSKESRTLASLRETLLPKLMRGEVRVKI